MEKCKQTEAQIEYKKFNKTSTIVTVCLLIGGIASASFIISAMVNDNLILVLVSVGVLLLWFAAMCAVVGGLNSKRLVLFEAAYGNEMELIHTGLFGEIWEEFERNQFEGLIDGKVIFAETYNNTIEMSIVRHKHEFNITIDKEAVYMVMDDETDTPVEKEIPLSEMTGVGQVFTVFREFVESI